MKTTHRPRSRNKIWISVWILASFLIVACMVKLGASFVAVPFIKIGSSFQKMGSAAVGIFTSKNSIEIENQQLKDRLAEVQVYVDRDKLLVQENSELKELLGRHSKNTSILAAVLSKPPVSLYDTLIVDVGSDDGVAVGDTVFALGLVPIGKISDIHQHISTVQLFSSAGQKVEVRINNNIQTFAEAQGGGNFLIKLPKGTVIAEGDPISAPGIGAEIFGHIEKIETDENDPFLHVRFNMPVNISEMHFLQIDRGSQ